MMMQRTPVIGETIPWEPPASLLGPALLGPVMPDGIQAPSTAWYILRTAPQKEAAACARLTHLGVLEAWYPVEEVTWRPRGATVSVTRERRIVPGYAFTLWGHEPRWHLLKDRSRGTIVGVVSVGDKPWAIKPAHIAQMAKVPGRIEALRREEEARREAERLAHAPVVGQPARIIGGPFGGMLVMVSRLSAGRAEFEHPETGIKGSAAASDLARLP